MVSSSLYSFVYIRWRFNVAMTFGMIQLFFTWYYECFLTVSSHAPVDTWCYKWKKTGKHIIYNFLIQLISNPGKILFLSLLLCAATQIPAVLNAEGANNAQFVIFQFLHVDLHTSRVYIIWYVDTDEKLINSLYFHQKYFMQDVFCAKRA